MAEPKAPACLPLELPCPSACGQCWTSARDRKRCYGHCRYKSPDESFLERCVGHRYARRSLSPPYLSSLQERSARERRSSKPLLLVPKSNRPAQEVPDGRY